MLYLPMRLKMRSFKKIIGILLIFILILNLNPPVSYARTEPETACNDEYKPDYEELMHLWDNAESKDQNAYRETFEAARQAHHDYIGCMFDFAERKIMHSDGSEQSGTMAANLLNTGGIPIFSSTIDWMSPEQACLTSQEIREVIEASEPQQMLTPILQAHSDYRDFLEDLEQKFSSKGTITDKQQVLNYETFARQKNLEIQSSLASIDMMFTSLRELRLAFVMHVHFQCMLKNLDMYRRKLGELREIIEPLPDQLRDASTS